MSGVAPGTVALVVALLSSSFGQLSYKQFFDERHGQQRDWRRMVRAPRLGAAVALFGIAQISFFLALRGLPVGVVYMSTGVTQVIVLVLSRVVLREAVGQDHLIAVVLILTGLALYAA